MGISDRAASAKAPALPRAAEIGLLIGLLLLGAFLRLFRLADQSIWYDEAFDVLLAQRPLTFILAQTVNDTMPPLHYVLLHLWMRIGDGEVIVKLFSAFMGILGTAAIYPLGRRLVGPRASLSGLLLMAVSPFQVYYAREVRMYSQLLFTSLMAGLFVLRCLGDQVRDPTGSPSSRWTDWVGLIGFSTLAVYTHTFGLLVPLALGSAALVRGRRDRAFLGRLVLSGAAVVVLALPWALWVLPTQASRVAQTFWVARPSAWAPISTLHMFLVGYTLPVVWVPVSLFAVLSTGAIALYQALRARRWAVTFLLVWLAGPILLVWAVSQWIPVYLDRLFIAGAPALYLLLGWSTGRMPRALRYALLGLLVGVICVSLGHYYYDRAYHKPPMRDVARYVASHARPGDVVLHTGDSSFLTAHYYQPKLEQFLASGDPDHRPGSARATALSLLGFSTVPVEQVSAAHERLWLVTALDHSVEFQSQVTEELLGERSLAWSANIGGVWVRLLVK